jgi:hypothetical protein
MVAAADMDFITGIAQVEADSYVVNLSVTLTHSGLMQRIV